MARSDAPLGLKPEEHSQLLVYHTDRLRVAQRAVDKAKEPLKDAQEELTARFNEAVARYNEAIGQFPALLLAWVFGFKRGRAL